MAEIFTVETRGIGKPDYTKDVSRSIQRAGLDLKYGQSIKSFYVIFTPLPSPFAWVKPPIAPGVSAHLVDSETNLDMPFTLPEGYTISAVQDSFGFKEDTEVWAYVDTFPIIEFSVSEGGLEVYRNRVIPFNTALLDPTGATSHLIDLVVTNRGLGNLEGSFALGTILEEVGTPPLPTIKTVRCKHCNHQWNVPNSTTQLICPKCGKLTIVYDLSSFRGTS